MESYSLNERQMEILRESYSLLQSLDPPMIGLPGNFHDFVEKYLTEKIEPLVHIAKSLVDDQQRVKKIKEEVVIYLKATCPECLSTEEDFCSDHAQKLIAIVTIGKMAGATISQTLSELLEELKSSDRNKANLSVN